MARRRSPLQSLGDLGRDAALGLRLLGHSPGFAAVAILTLAVGIGANTAIYSVLDAVLLRPLPYPEPQRIVEISETLENGMTNSVSGGVFLDWRTHQTQFEAIALTGRVTANLRGTSATERVRGLEVSHEFLRVLGVEPLLGRGFVPEDDRPGGSSDVVVITEELWRSRFVADAGIVGRRIVLDEVPRTVVGVLPKGTWLFTDEAFFVPAVLTPGSERAQRAPHWATVFGRLGAGVSVAQADAELKAIKRQLNAEYPIFKRDWSVRVRPVTDLIGGVARPPLLILLGAVALVLLIACGNVANLLLARGLHRQQELAVRAALGASGSRLARQALTESVTLAVLGGLAGVVVGYAGLGVLGRMAAQALPVTFEPRLDLRVLAFTLGVTVATGLLFGLLPAWRARRPALNGMLNDGGRGGSAGGRQRAQAALVGAELALTVVLVTSAGLLLRSLWKTATADPGFDPARVLAIDLSLPRATYDTPEQRLAFTSTLLGRVRALPGVEQAGTAMAIPFAGGGYGEYFRRVDRTDPLDRALGRVDYVSPGYLETLGVRMLGGRAFEAADNRADGPRVTVINETAARLFFGGTEAIGQSLNIAGEAWQVVGVIADVVDRRLDLARMPFAYAPQAFDSSQLSLAVRTPLDPMSLVGSVRNAVERLDTGVAIANPRVLDGAMAGSMMQRRIVLALVATFAATALLLAGIGLYGVMAYAVATRRRELGIRLALGAGHADVIRQVVNGGMRMLTVGVAIGLGGAVASARVLASELYQIRGFDPPVVVFTIGIVSGIALLACWLPARRAAQLDPAIVFRND